MKTFTETIPPSGYQAQLKLKVVVLLGYDQHEYKNISVT